MVVLGAPSLVHADFSPSDFHASVQLLFPGEAGGGSPMGDLVEFNRRSRYDRDSESPRSTRCPSPN